MTITFPTLSLCGLNTHATTELLDDHRALEPPDPIPNSAVKRCIADGSVGFPHVRVGHRQAPYRKAPIWKQVGAFLFGAGKCRLRGTKDLPYLSAQRACAPCRTTALASLHCRS